MRNFPKLSSNSFGLIKERLKKKASQSISRFKISAVAFDKNGEFLGQSMNSVPMAGIIQKPGSGIHAESKLMRKYGTLIKTIILSRVGHGGDWRQISPCHHCRELADKLGIKIITIDECHDGGFYH